MQKQSFRQLVVRLWPAGLLWLLLMIADFFAARAVTYGYMPMPMFPAMFGFFFAQFFLATTLGGLVGRSWTTGWLLAVILTTVAIVICQLAYLPLTSAEATESFAIIAFVPLLMLAACAPLMAMRVLRGWTLTLDQQFAVERQKASLEDMLLLSVIVACSVSLMRVVSEFSPGFSQSSAEMMLLAFFFSFSLLFGLPAIWITFRARRWSYRLLGWATLAVIVVAACMLVNWVMNPNLRNDPMGALSDIAESVGSCVLTAAVGVSVLLACNVRLTRSAKVGERLAAEADAEAEADKAALRMRSARWQTRLVTGGTMIVALLVSVGISLSHYRKTKFLEGVQAFGKQGPDLGSSIAIREDKIVSLAVAPQTTDAAFSRYRMMQDLERISLAHSRVTDAVVLRLEMYPNLIALDLSDTAFTDAGLRELEISTIRPNELSLAKTQVSYRQAIETAGALHIGKLDLSELDVRDDQLSQPLPLYITSLALRGNPITDKGLAQLLRSAPRLTELDVSHTDIDGSGIVASRCPATLILDNTKITDANLIAILKKNPSITVSLKNTAITAQVLRHVVNSQANLSLGGGQISESDLVRLGQVGIPQLRLNGPEFTGACVADGGLQVQLLDLSHSSANDASVTKICQSGQSFAWKLVLAHTRVTDAVLPALQSLACSELDLRHTNITAQGLLQSELKCGRIIVSHDQFPPGELTLLGQRYRLAFDEETWWPD